MCPFYPSFAISLRFGEWHFLFLLYCSSYLTLCATPEHRLLWQKNKYEQEVPLTQL